LLQPILIYSDDLDELFPSKTGKRLCGNLNLTHYKLGTENQIAPWNALIVTSFSKQLHCFGALIAPIFPSVNNGSDIVLSVSSCGHRHGRKLRSISASVFFGVHTFPFLPIRAMKFRVKTVIPLTIRSNGKESEKRYRDDGLLLLQLRKTVPSNKVMPLCLAEFDAYPPNNAKCYSIIKKKGATAFTEQSTNVPKNPKKPFCQYNSAIGLCLWAHRFTEFVAVGSPLYCEIDGIVYLYGIYRSNEIELITSVGKQWAGFFISLHVFYLSLHDYKKTLERLIGSSSSSESHRDLRSSIAIRIGPL
ncbi:hypothetical protein D918_03220, partial [Trichuris suis]